jgi:hypothetical protein
MDTEANPLSHTNDDVFIDIEIFTLDTLENSYISYP